MNGMVTCIELDVKSQYTNLKKKYVKQAIKFAISECKDIVDGCFHIAKNRQDKKQDGYGRADPGRFYMVTFDDILKYVKIELNFCYFKVGGSLIFKQIDGLPMGGLVSCALAVLYTMYNDII